MSKLFIEDNTLIDIADAIREKRGYEDLIAPGNMASEIRSIETGGGGEEIPDEALVISGNCEKRFVDDNWKGLMEAVGHRMRSENITNMNNMLNRSTMEIPFDLNMNPSSASHNISYAFGYYYGPYIPMVYGAKPEKTEGLFLNASKIIYLPEGFGDDWDWSYIDDAAAATYNGQAHSMFAGCHSLRAIPVSLLHGNKGARAGGTIFCDLGQDCHSLDELLDVPNPHYEGTYTETGYNNLFYNMCKEAHRLQNFTFAPMDPPNWSNQVIDLSRNVGWGSVNTLNKSCWITTDTEVVDDDSYQQLKDNPDWWTRDVLYSRYNFDSAVRTLNSLPDTSAFGTNTIKFKGESGAGTEAAGCDYLNQEPSIVAAAAAKGWTVAMV